MINKTPVKIGDRLSVRITEKIDKNALDWLNVQENRSRSIIRLITAFAKIEKTQSGEFIKLLMESVDMDDKRGDKPYMSDKIRGQMSDNKNTLNNNKIRNINSNVSDYTSSDDTSTEDKSKDDTSHDGISPVNMISDEISPDLETSDSKNNMSDKMVKTDKSERDIYSEVFGTIELKKGGDRANTNKKPANILNALNSIKR